MPNGLYEKKITIHDVAIELSVLTIENETYELRIENKSKNDIEINCDSLKVYYNNQPVQYNFYNSKYEMTSGKYLLTKKNDFVFYVLLINKSSIRVGDRLIIFANKYFNKDGQYYDLEKITFISDKIYQ
jgi:hypothetical protein